MKKACLFLTLILFASNSWAQGVNPGASSTFTEQQRVELGILFKQWITNNPAVIKRALNQPESLPQGVSNPNDGELGNHLASKTIVMFADWNSPASRLMIVSIAAVLAKDDDVRVIIKDLPLLSQSSIQAAICGLTLRKQGTGEYLKFLKAISSFQGELTGKDIDRIAQESSSNIEDYNRNFGRSENMEYLKSVRNIAEQMKITGTPVLLVGDQVLLGLQSPDKIREVLAKSAE